MNKGGNPIEKSSSLYKTYKPTVILKHKPKRGKSYKRQMVYPTPQTPQSNQSIRLILILVLKSDMEEFQRNLSIPVF